MNICMSNDVTRRSVTIFHYFILSVSGVFLLFSFANFESEERWEGGREGGREGVGQRIISSVNKFQTLPGGMASASSDSSLDYGQMIN